ncbi:MAG: hypothetical protein Q8R98_28085, partial [Rubrivivax sp.]|nr:hypothetical protein [Rubrivivax sp.]
MERWRNDLPRKLRSITTAVHREHTMNLRSPVCRDGTSGRWASPLNWAMAVLLLLVPAQAVQAEPPQRALPAPAFSTARFEAA